MREGPKKLDDILAEDRETLRQLGYAQELFREMGGFANFAVSFSRWRDFGTRLAPVRSKLNNRVLPGSSPK
jgi:hypothetical protein